MTPYLQGKKQTVRQWISQKELWRPEESGTTFFT